MHARAHTYIHTHTHTHVILSNMPNQLMFNSAVEYVKKNSPDSMEGLNKVLV